VQRVPVVRLPQHQRAPQGEQFLPHPGNNVGAEGRGTSSGGARQIFG
jgi:hypothetical protein